jgi:chromosome segregation ATPase
MGLKNFIILHINIMSTGKLDVSFENLNKVLDTVTQSLTDIKQIRDEQYKSISNLSHTIDIKTSGINEKYNKLESKIRRVENDMVEDINKVRSQNKTVTSGIDKRLVSLEVQIKLMEEAIQSLKTQQEENNRQLEELRPKIGQKRKRFWMCF